MFTTLFLAPTISYAQGIWYFPDSFYEQEEWFFSGALSANVAVVEGESATSAGLGVGIHHMLGDKFSAGINLFYAGSEGINTVEPDINFAYYGKLTDNLYYVPEVQLGVVFFIEPKVAAFGAGVSPFGLEFRPTRKLGFRVNILTLTYANMEGVNVFNGEIGSSLAIICRF